MKEIELRGGKGVIKVDDEDYEYLSQFNWNLWGQYAIATINVHRMIMKPAPDQVVDHINGDKMDNRRCNLRVCNKSQNQMNARKLKSKTSKYRGIHKASSGKWSVSFSYKGKSTFVGEFRDELHAAMAYDMWIIDHYGEYGLKNFEPVLFG